MVYDNDGPIYSVLNGKGCPGICVPLWVAAESVWTDRQGCIDNDNTPESCDACLNPTD